MLPRGVSETSKPRSSRTSSSDQQGRGSVRYLQTPQRSYGSSTVQSRSQSSITRQQPQHQAIRPHHPSSHSSSSFNRAGHDSQSVVPPSAGPLQPSTIATWVPQQTAPAPIPSRASLDSHIGRDPSSLPPAHSFFRRSLSSRHHTTAVSTRNTIDTDGLRARNAQAMDDPITRHSTRPASYPTLSNKLPPPTKSHDRLLFLPDQHHYHSALHDSSVPSLLFQQALALKPLPAPPPPSKSPLETHPLIERGFSSTGKRSWEYTTVI